MVVVTKYLLVNSLTDNAELDPEDSLKDIVDGDSGQLKGIVDSWEVGRMDDRVNNLAIILQKSHKKASAFSSQNAFAYSQMTAVK